MKSEKIVGIKRPMLAYEAAKQLLTPHYSKIALSIRDGFENCQKGKNKMYEASGFITFEKRSEASLIHDFIKKEVKQNFQGEPNVEVGEWNGVFALKINEDLLIRFKKLNNDYSASNYLTKQTKCYNHQFRIEGFPDQPMFLTAGYVPNKTWTDISIYITCRIDTKLLWVESLSNKAESIHPMLPFAEVDEVFVEKRVKVKKASPSDDKTGTDNV